MQHCNSKNIIKREEKLKTQKNIWKKTQLHQNNVYSLKHQLSSDTYSSEDDDNNSDEEGSIPCSKDKKRKNNVC